MRTGLGSILKALGGAAFGALACTPAAYAVTAPIADAPKGHMLGVGLAGLSWDYGWPHHALGLEIHNTGLFPTEAQDRFLLSSRGIWRLGGSANFAVSALGGIQLDPGLPGNRAYLIPDAGLGVSYRLKVGVIPLALRFNVTLTLDQGQNGRSYPVYGNLEGISPPVTGNLLQRLTLGPNTALGLALRPDDNYELTVGGGTLVGLRLRY